MKNVAFIVFCLIALPLFVAAQTPIDTISAYDVSYEIIKSGGKATYKINGKKASKEEVDIIVEANKKKNSCTPCFLISLDADKNIHSTGIYYAQCPGKTVEEETSFEGYSQTTVIKSTSCRDGEWKYFNSKGELIETKYFDLGEEVPSTE